jgi:hypothetical protein
MIEEIEIFNNFEMQYTFTNRKGSIQICSIYYGLGIKLISLLTPNQDSGH